MPQLNVHDRVDDILKLDLAVRMKKQGFRKRTRGFARDAQMRGATSGKAVQVCEIDVGGSSSSHEGVVSATLAVFYPDFVPLITPWQTKLPAQIKAVDGQVRVKLGLLGPWNDPHHAWRVNPDTTDEAIAKELADAVETFGVPFLDSMLDLANIAASTIEGVSPELKILALAKLGRRDDAKAATAALLAARPKEYMAVASLAGRLKLPVPPRPAK
jgi:hypothetical protein